MIDCKFLKVSRGFTNAYVVFSIPQDRVAEAEAEFANFEDDNPGCSASWVSGRGYGLDAVDWTDRARLGYGPGYINRA